MPVTQEDSFCSPVDGCTRTPQRKAAAATGHDLVMVTRSPAQIASMPFRECHHAPVQGALNQEDVCELVTSILLTVPTRGSIRHESRGRFPKP